MLCAGLHFRWRVLAEEPLVNPANPRQALSFGESTLQQICGANGDDDELVLISSGADDRMPSLNPP
jgi:hypothetical protein